MTFQNLVVNIQSILGVDYAWKCEPGYEKKEGTAAEQFAWNACISYNVMKHFSPHLTTWCDENADVVELYKNACPYDLCMQSVSKTLEKWNSDFESQESMVTPSMGLMSSLQLAKDKLVDMLNVSKKRK